MVSDEQVVTGTFPSANVNEMLLISFINKIMCDNVPLQRDRGASRSRRGAAPQSVFCQHMIRDPICDLFTSNVIH